METSVTTYHLEMTAPSDLRPRRAARSDLVFTPIPAAFPELSRFFYTAVGADVYWTVRLPWTRAQWLAYLERPELESWVLSAGGIPAGFVELERQPPASVEIVKLGLLPPFIGRGLGGHLTTVGVERAWAMGATRVWLHTCTLDHPGALANYRARGFRIFLEEVTARDLTGGPPGPWPGSGR